MNYKYNEQQSALIAWIKRAIKQDHKQALQVIARAGCGKTTMLLEMASVVSQAGHSMGIYAFNKPIADELKDRISRDHRLRENPPKAATLHSAGMSMVRQAVRNLRLDDQKVSNTIRDSQRYRALARELPGGYRCLRKFLIRAVGVVRRMSPLDCDGIWWDVLEESNIQGMEGYRSSGRWAADTYQLERSVQALMNQIDEDLIHRGSVDFDDLLYQPIKLGITPHTVARSEIVGIDEAQDCSRVRMLLAEKLVDTRETGPRILIYVGDPAQSIYGFTGAVPGAMDQFGQYLQDRGYTLETLHLSHTYRCSQAVVREAQKWVPGFTAASDNPQGAVLSLPFDETLKGVSSLLPDTAVLCRNTGPLLKLWLDALSVQGGGNGTGSGLIPATEWKLSIETGPIRDYLMPYPDDTSLDRVNQELLGEISKELAREDEKKNWSRLERVQDIHTVVRAFMDSFPHYTVSDLTETLVRADKPMSNGGGKAVTLMTCHKAKGKEFETVYLLAPNLLMPSKRAKKPEEREQEANLEYVATTRARTRLVRVICQPEDIGRILGETVSKDSQPKTTTLEDRI